MLCLLGYLPTYLSSSFTLSFFFFFVYNILFLSNGVKFIVYLTPLAIRCPKQAVTNFYVNESCHKLRTFVHIFVFDSLCKMVDGSWKKVTVYANISTFIYDHIILITAGRCSDGDHSIVNFYSN